MADRELAPIVLFAYNRCQHLQATLESLARNPQASRSQITIFSDGPKGPADAEAIAGVRAFASNITGFLRVDVVERPTNLGLAESVIQGVSQILREHDRVIVLEDDMIVSPHFLAYMNDGLARYEEESAVASIHGYMYPSSVDLPDMFFLRGADCWGWATWRRAWKHFNADGEILLAELKSRNLIHAFDYDGEAPFSEMLAKQITGENNSWAIRWHASCYLDGMLTLYPGQSLVYNIGNDGSGTHGATGSAGQRFGRSVSTTPVQMGAIPICESIEGYGAVRDFFRRTRRRSLYEKAICLVSRHLEKMFKLRRAIRSLLT